MCLWFGEVEDEEVLLVVDTLLPTEEATLQAGDEPITGTAVEEHQEAAMCRGVEVGGFHPLRAEEDLLPEVAEEEDACLPTSIATTKPTGCEELG